MTSISWHFPSNINRHQLITNKPENENAPTTTPNSTNPTKIGTKFIELINKHFGSNHPYRKIFNKKTLEVSYCLAPNIKVIINGHNKILLNTSIAPTPACNCRAKNNCPVEGKRQLKNVIYRATVTSNSNDERQYIGSTSRNFERWLYEHRTSFPSNTRLVQSKNCTEYYQTIYRSWRIRTHSTTSCGKFFTVPQTVYVRTMFFVQLRTLWNR